EGAGREPAGTCQVEVLRDVRPQVRMPDPSADLGVTRKAENAGVDVAVLPLSQLEKRLMRLPGTYYVGYRLWHWRVFKLARQMHAEQPFDLVHHVSFCGYREPSDGWKLGAPFVWGPVGGTQSFPVKFVGALDPRGAFRELLRNVVNYWQLHFHRRIRQAAKAASVVLAANRQVGRDLAKAFEVKPIVQLETGVDPCCSAVREPRDPARPLRILWSGRLQPWKGLPLLLRALAMLPPEVRYELRVMGQGPCLRGRQRLARRLGIANHVEWIGWPDYAGQLPHYQWADLFAFTSLRDTSGTGLLEALAAGAPIIGLNHQGAADVMADACAIAVDPSSPSVAVEGFRNAIVRLAGDAALLKSLSDGAFRRAEQFTWERQWQVMRSIYHSLLTTAAVEAPAAPYVPTDQSAGRKPVLVEA
ncbi:MAG TPA: glycosyltransferase, partial [Lacipirellula sp.]